MVPLEKNLKLTQMCFVMSNMPNKKQKNEKYTQIIVAFTQKISNS